MLLEPLWLLGFLALPVLAWWQLRRRQHQALSVPSLSLLANLPRGLGARLRHTPLLLRLATMALLVVALARPVGINQRTQKTSDGLDIVLAVDTSMSMEARDFILDNERPRRLDVVKKVINDFIASRPDDRIGMVVFGSEAYTQSPLTLDHTILSRFLSRVQTGMAGNATAIGDGLATAVNRIKTVEAKSKIVILLTDGSNNAGRVDPMAAARAAKALGIKTYTIGAGTNGMAPIVIDGRVTSQKVEIDEDLLRAIAEETGGQYFRATDTESLVKVYATIDKLEKTKVKTLSFEKHEEAYHGLVVMALLLIGLELVFALTRFRSLP